MHAMHEVSLMAEPEARLRETGTDGSVHTAQSAFDDEVNQDYGLSQQQVDRQTNIRSSQVSHGTSAAVASLMHLACTW